MKSLQSMPNVRMRTRTTAVGVHDHGYVLLHERLTDHAPDHSVPRHRLWKVRAGRILMATGAIERPLSFAGNDRPGCMLASAVRDYVVNYGVAPGERTVILTNNDDAYRTALTLREAGLGVPAILDARQEAAGPLAKAARDAGLSVRPGCGIAGIVGRDRVDRIQVCSQDGDGKVIDEIQADCIAMSGGWSPAAHLWCHAGGKLSWNDVEAHFAPDPARPPTGGDGMAMMQAVGGASGAMHAGAALESAHAAGVSAGEALGNGRSRKPGRVPEGEDEAHHPMEPVWLMPARAPYSRRAKSWLDFQNDVKVSDMELAAREGYESVEHAKRYTTLGMATDQGKLSNINGLAILSRELGAPVEEVGTTTFRPPYVPGDHGRDHGRGPGRALPARAKNADSPMA